MTPGGSKRKRLGKRGQIVIISSPSGGGKTSICRKLLTPTRKNLGWRFSVSYTTRQRRKGEQDGREYQFVSLAEFRKMAAGSYFVESFKVHGHNYGTPRISLEKVIKGGGVLLLDVDWRGGLKIKRGFPDATTIFVMPPSKAVLRKRLESRATETREQLNLRFANAIREMECYRRFEYTVFNRDLKQAVREVLSIIEAHPCRSDLIDSEQIDRLLVK